MCDESHDAANSTGPEMGNEGAEGSAGVSDEVVAPGRRLPGTGRTSLGPDDQWIHGGSQVGLTKDVWEDVSAYLEGTYQTHPTTIGFRVIAKDETVPVNAELLDGFDRGRVPPGGGDDFDTVRYLARHRDLDPERLKAMWERRLGGTNDGGTEEGATESASSTDDDTETCPGPSMETDVSTESGRSSPTTTPSRVRYRVSPAEVPELRDDLVACLNDPATAGIWRLRETSGGNVDRFACPPYMMSLGEARQRVAERDRVTRATLFTMPRDMGQLIGWASDRLPTRLCRDDAPAVTGLVYYPTFVSLHSTLHVYFICWEVSDTGLWVSWYGEDVVNSLAKSDFLYGDVWSLMSSRKEFLCPGGTQLRWREDQNGACAVVDEMSIVNEVVRVLAATWVLMGTPFVGSHVVTGTTLVGTGLAGAQGKYGPCADDRTGRTSRDLEPRRDCRSGVMGWGRTSRRMR